MMRPHLLLPLALCASCDYSGDFLFGDDPEVDDIWVLNSPDGGPIVPADIDDIDQLRAATIYGEVGAPSTTADGGITFDFVGTGRDVCIWVDPEVAFWSQAVAERPDATLEKWTYPDNVFDDGDIDLLAGQSVYYTGSPGEEVGDFVVQYEDSLGNQIPISLASCPNVETAYGELSAGGRGAPEFCTISNTSLGIGYTVLLRTFSTPLDDDRLSFGLIVANGTCTGLQGLIAGGGQDSTYDECLIQGEALTPNGAEFGPFYGFDEINDAGRIWPGSIDFEAAFCDPSQIMRPFCRDEIDRVQEAGNQCSWNETPDENTRCYCGDENDAPNSGGL